MSEPEFVRQPTADGGSELWQIVRYDEPDVDLMPAKIYLNGFRLLWTDSGMPAALPDGTPVPPDIVDVIILDGPTVFGDVLICLTGQPDQAAWIRHDQLLIKPPDVVVVSELFGEDVCVAGDFADRLTARSGRRSSRSSR